MKSLPLAVFLILPCVPTAAQTSDPPPSAPSLSVESDGVRAAARGIVGSARAAREAQSEVIKSGDADGDSAQDYKGLRHYEKVAEGVYRSGRLNREGLERLYDMGFQAILDLEGESAYQEERRSLDEIESARKAAGKPERHIVSENEPMSITHPPGQDQIDRALAILSDPAKRPILVHCEHGSDRTGVVVAAYRVEIEKKMAIGEAVQEAKAEHCCHWVIKGKDGLENYLISYHAYRAGSAPMSSNP
ncbi:MAG: tyrosine-protein phosphatase [Elusimicrobiota bacterium]